MAPIHLHRKFTRLLLSVLLLFIVFSGSIAHSRAICIDIFSFERTGRSPFNKLLIGDMQELTVFLHDKGVDVNGTKIQNDKSERTKALIHNYAQINAKGSQLYTYVVTVLKIHWTQEWLPRLGLASAAKAGVPLSRDDIFKSLMALKEIDYDLDHTNMTTPGTPAALRAIEAAIGFPAEPSAVYHQGITKYQSWPKWISEIGLRIERVRRIAAPNAEYPIDSLMLALLFLDVPLYGGQIQSNRSTKIAKRIHELTGYYLTPAQIYYYVTRVRETPWTEWLNHNNLGHLVLRTRSLSIEEITLGIQALNSNGKYDFTPKVMKNDASEASAQKLQRALKIHISPAQLYYQASLKIPHFNNAKWIQILRGAGVNVNITKMRLLSKDAGIDQDSITAVIRLFSSSKRPIHSEAFRTDDSQESAEYIYANTGVLATPSRIHTAAATSEQNGWNKALARAGFDPLEVRYPPPPPPAYRMFSKHQIIRGIRALDDGKYDFGPASMVRDNSADSAKKLSKVFGQHVTPKQLYYSAINYKEIRGKQTDTPRRRRSFHRQWIKILHRSGVRLNLRDMFLRPEASGINQNSISAIIQLFHSTGRKINARAFSKDTSAESTEFIYEHLDIITTPSRVYSLVATHETSGWDKALVRAGFNPDYIRIRGWAAYSVLSQAMKYERGEMMERRGQFLHTQAYGEVNKDGTSERIAAISATPETEMAARKFSQTLESTKSSLETRDQLIFELLSRIIEEKPDIDISDALIAVHGELNQRGLKINLEAVTSFTSRMVQNAELRDAFLDMIHD